MPENNEQINQKRKFKFFRYGIYLSVVCLLLLIINGVGIYKFNWQGKITMALVDYLPYPAVIVNNDIVSFKEYLDNYQVIKYFNENQVLENKVYQVTEGGLKVEVLNKLILNRIVAQQADLNGVSVSQEEIDYELNNIKSNLSEGDNLDDRLAAMYGMSEDNFIKNLLSPEILYSKLHQKYIEDNNIDRDAKLKNNNQKIIAQGILDKIRQGESFEEMAKKESDDEITKEYAGDLGYFGKGEMVQEFEQAAFDLNIGEISEVIETSYGFHIIQVTDKKEDTEGVETIRASHILIKTNDNYNEWLLANMAAARVFVLVPGFIWQNGQIAFK